MDSVLEEINNTPQSTKGAPADRTLETIVTDATAGLALDSETEKIRHVMLVIMQDYQLLRAENKE